MQFAIDSGATYVLSIVLLILFCAGAYMAFLVSLDEPIQTRR